MPFLPSEYYDDLTQEVRKDVAGTIHFHARLDGEQVTASSATFVVYDPGGTQIQGTTAATITTTSGASRISCAVSAIGTLDEDYRCEISWVVSGTTYFDVVMFDCVLYPFGQPMISYSDMVGERPESDDILTRLAAILGLSTDADAAGTYALKGHVALDGLIRASISDSQTGSGLGNHTRPHLILNRERLRQTALYLTMREMYKADAKDLSEDTDESSAQSYREYKALAEAAWRAVGPLKFNVDDDLEVETVEHRVGGIVQQSRGW